MAKTVFKQGIDIRGDLNATDNVEFGSDSGKTVTFNSRIASDYVPSVDLTYDMGSNTLKWNEIHAGTVVIYTNIDLQGNRILNPPAPSNPKDFVTLEYHNTDINTLSNNKADKSTILTAADGLDGGGDLSQDRSFAVDSTVARRNADNTFAGLVVIQGTLTVQSNTDITGRLDVTNGVYDNNVRLVDYNRTVTAGDGLDGGGDLSADVTVSVDDTVARRNEPNNFVGDVSIQGNLSVSGTTVQVDSEISTADRVVLLNDGETGSGVTNNFAGIEIDRGTLTNYEFGFNETTGTFELGEIGDRQPVATREITPNDGGVAYWDAATSRFLTTTDAVGTSVTYDVTPTDTETDSSFIMRAGSQALNKNFHVLLIGVSDLNTQGEMTPAQLETWFLGLGVDDGSGMVHLMADAATPHIEFPAGWPDTFGSFVAYVSPSNSYQYTWQEITSANENERWVRRATSATTWTDWQLYFHSGNTASEAQSKAATLDNVAATPLGTRQYTSQFGIGPAGDGRFDIGSSIDAPDFNGFGYASSSAAGLPAAETFEVWSALDAAQDYGLQIIKQQNADNIYVRSFAAGTPRPFVELVHDGNLTSTSWTWTSTQTFESPIVFDKSGELTSLSSAVVDNADAWHRIGNGSADWLLKYVGTTSGTDGNEFRVESTDTGRYIQFDHDGNFEYYDGTNTHKIWTAANDGDGSGLNADTVDGIQAENFLRSDSDDTVGGKLTFANSYYSYANDPANFAINFNNSDVVGFNSIYFDDVSDNTNEGLMFYRGSGLGEAAWSNLRAYNDQLLFSPIANGTAYEVFHQGNDGSGSGLDADTVDGIQAENFLRSDTDDTAVGNLVFTNELRLHGTTYWQVSGSDTARQRVDARDDATSEARLHWYGLNDAGQTRSFKSAWYDGAKYVFINVSNETITFEDGHQTLVAPTGNSNESKFRLVGRNSVGSPESQVEIAAQQSGPGSDHSSMILRTRDNGVLTDHMVVDHYGRIGIGTSTPTAILETSQDAGSVVGALFTNRNQSGTADSVTINFGLGRTGDTSIRSMPVIRYQKEQEWTTTSTTADAFLAFSTTRNETTSEKMRITSDGDVGIGTITPGDVLELQRDQDADTALAIDNDNTGASSSVSLKLQGQGNNFTIRNYGDGTANADETRLMSSASGSKFTFYTEGTEKLRLTADGSLLVATNTSDNFRFKVNAGINGTQEGIIVSSATRTDTESDISLLRLDGNAGYGTVFNVTGGGLMQLSPGGTEALRVDSSRRLLIGTTTALQANENTNEGHTFGGNGYQVSARTSTSPNFYVSKVGAMSDAEFIRFSVNSNSVGAVKVMNGDRVALVSTNCGIKLPASFSQLQPTDSGGTNTDGVMNLGGTGNRWNDVYTSGTHYHDAGADNYGGEYEIQHNSTTSSLDFRFVG